MSVPSQDLSAHEDWQDLVSWDGEIYDPLFQGDISFASTNEFEESFASDYHVPESVVSDQPSYVPSAPVSVVGDIPPSSIDGSSSLTHTFSWLSASPSFSTTATSPLVERNEKQYCGVPARGYDLSSFNTTFESPILGTTEDALSASYNSSNSYQTASPYIFNPFLAGSPHSFSSRDVHASRAIANVGGWAEQPQIIEPVPELDHAGAIAIPHSHTNGYANSLPPYQLDTQHDLTRARAITIPQPNPRTASHSSHLYTSRHMHPVLSVSPDAKTRPRSVALARSISGREARRGRNSLTTPSPTSNTFGWVSYHPNETNKLIPLGVDGSRGKRQRGRTKGLTVEQRRNAALMRVIGACSNCKKRKERCDPGIPCRSCIEHYKGDLVHNPCRDRLLSDLSKAFLSERLGWHPTARSIKSFFQDSEATVSTGSTYLIPLRLGFGPPLHLPVHPLEVYNVETLYHEHIIYSWPPTTPTGESHVHAVLPVVLTSEVESSLSDILQSHLSLLVMRHFRSFPLYCSQLRILREVYVFYRSLPTASADSRLLHQALKLLVLVHIGGDLTLPSPSDDPILSQLVRTMLPIDNVVPTPCFIRSQFGAVMPSLALSMMKDVLSSLEQLLLNRECRDWPIVLAVLIVVLLTIESIHYHAAKLPYHHVYDAKAAVDPHAREEERKIDELGVKTLLTFYAACFSGCHARLKEDWEGEVAQTSVYATTSGSGDVDPVTGLKPEDRFVESVREAVKKAAPGGYLAKKATGERDGDDMEFFFDRLVARLLLLKI